MDGLEVELDALERILCGQKEPDSLDFRLLQRLTGNFSDDRRIGEGGCGEVYMGKLPNGKLIAVKRLKKDQIIDEKMFLREVDSMIKARHQNIVRFLGYCSEIKEKAVPMDDGKIVMAEEREKLLCFPYISNGSLDKHLTDELRGFEWHTRYQIIKGICDGLLHLHTEKGIMHMDLKPANILLGDQMVPKITDFGVSRIDGKTQITSAERLFSLGHAAPEYIDTGERSWKSDIYSLGVIMTELVTGSRKIPNITKVLRKWRHRWNKSSKHTPPLWYLQVKKCLELAVSCQEKKPINRPFIRDVVCELNKLDSWDGQIRESSLEKIMSSSDDMLGIEPLELHFTLAHDKEQISCSIELTNDTDYYMAFRIATTSLLLFSIQPDKGIAAPRSKCRTTITLPAQEMARLKNHHEGFIVQSTRVDGSLTAVDITVDMFNEEGGDSQKKNYVVDKVVDEVNLTVHQKDLANLSAEMGSLGTSSQIIKNEDLEELRELGSGIFGTVYHGKWRGSDVAIERIKKSCFTGRSSEQERLAHEFWREAEILSKLHHPNVVAFYGVVKDGPGGTLATVTEFMVNGSLRRVLQREDKYLDRRKRLIIAMDAAFGMEYVHSNNIVHFDLKCDNLLVKQDQTRPICKVGNFGLSKIKRNTLVSGGVRGTLPWMAPELLNGSSNMVSEKVDVFSFGIVMWEILTGEEPYANMHYGAIIGGIVNNTLRPPVPGSCDAEWKRLMEQCWAPDPVQRPAFTEIAGRLRAMSAAANQVKAAMTAAGK